MEDDAQGLAGDAAQVWSTIWLSNHQRLGISVKLAPAMSTTVSVLRFASRGLSCQKSGMKSQKGITWKGIRSFWSAVR